MQKFENDKRIDITAKILGGLTIPTAIFVFFIWLISFPVFLLSGFTLEKLGLLLLVDFIAYAVASFVDVSSNGIPSLKKRIYSKNIEAIKVKSIKLQKSNDDT